MEELLKRIALVQEELHAPKSQYNSFGKYNYRSQEDILESVKPLLKKHGLTMLVKDEIREVGEHVYVEATAAVHFGTDRASVTACAGVDFKVAGMQMPQRYGAASSYARKYALNGMFLIDDTKDADATNTHGKTEVTKTVTKKKLTAAIKKAMKEAVANGQKDAVVSKLANYEVSDKDKAEILG
jgi:hypothetical protein